MNERQQEYVASELLSELDAELNALRIAYGIDSGAGGEFAAGIELSIQVTPFKAHLLERFVLSDEMAAAIEPISVTVGMNAPAVPLRYDDTAADYHPSIVPAVPRLVVSVNELIDVKVRTRQTVKRVTLTAVARAHPAAHMLERLHGEFATPDKSMWERAGELQGVDRLQQLWEKYACLARHFENIRADQRQTEPLTDDMLGLAPPRCYQLPPEPAPA